VSNFINKRASQKWWVLATVALTWIVVMDASIASLSIYLLPVSKTFSVPVGTVGYSASAFVFAMTLISPILGRVIDLFGARRVMSVGAIISAIGFVVASMSQNIDQYIGAMVVLGIGMGTASYIPGVIVISKWFDTQFGLATGIAMAASSIGSGLVPIGISWLISLVGWQRTMLIVAVILVLVILPIIMLGIREPQTQDAPPRPVKARRRTEKIWKIDAWRQPIVWLLLGVVLLSGIGYSNVFVYIVPYLEKVGFASTTAATLYGLTGIASGIGAITFGLFADRIGLKSTFLVGLTICALSTPLILLAGNRLFGLTATLAFVVFWGATHSLSPIYAPLILRRAISQRNYGLIIGSVQLVYGLAQTQGTIITASIYNQLLSYVVPFLLSAIMMAAGAFIIIFMGIPFTPNLARKGANLV
jgi:predicted MFS family arabinose efflux permease